MDDAQIIDALVPILRRPSDRETERWRYFAYMITTVCTWLTREEMDSIPASALPIPLFGGPPDEHYPRSSSHTTHGNGVPIEDLGCSGCLYIYNNTGTDHVLVYDDCGGENLIAKASKGDRDADAVLCIIAEKHARISSPMPWRLGGYVSEILGRRAVETQYNEGGDRHANFTRNLMISWAVANCERYGIGSKTRANRLVHEALKKVGVHISTDGIRQILKRLDTTAPGSSTIKPGGSRPLSLLLTMPPASAPLSPPRLPPFRGWTVSYP